MQSNHTETAVIHRITRHSQATHNTTASNSIAMAIIKLKDYYLGQDASEDSINALYLEFVAWIHSLRVENFFKDETIAISLELQTEIIENLSQYTETLLARSREETNPDFDIVTLYKLNSAGIYINEQVEVPLKTVLALFYKACTDHTKFAHNYSETDISILQQAQNDYPLRLQSFYNCLKRIQGLCHTGVRHEIILLLNHTYEGINIIEDDVAFIMSSIRDEINQQLNHLQESQLDNIKAALCTWIDEQNPETILNVIDPTDTIKQKISNTLILNGINPQQLNVIYANENLSFEALFTKLSTQLAFFADAQHPQVRIMANILTEPQSSSDIANQALNTAQTWIRNSLVLNSSEHTKIISGFYAVYKTQRNIIQEQTLLLATGIMQQDEINTNLVMCSTYLQSIINLKAISAPELEVLTKIQQVNQKIHACKRDNLVETITNFFSIWFADDLETKKSLYSILIDDRNHKKILLDDSTIEKILINNRQATETFFSPYEINRIFLSAIIQNPNLWTNLFASILHHVLIFVQTTMIEHNHLAQALQQDSYPIILIQQLEYLLSLRTIAPKTRPAMMLLLPKQISNLSEWSNFYTIVSEKTLLQTYTAYKTFFKKKFIHDLGNPSYFYTKNIYQCIPKEHQIDFFLEILVVEHKNILRNYIIKKNSLENLINLAQDNDLHINSIIENGAIKIIIPLLNNPDYTIQYLSAKLLSLITSHNNQNIIVEYNIIAMLINLLESSSIFAKNNALSTLNILLFNKIYLNTIHEHNGIKSIIALLNEPNEITRILTLRILCQLTCNENNKNAIRKHNGITQIIHQLNTNHLETRSMVITILMQLSDHNDHNKNIIYNIIGKSILLNILAIVPKDSLNEFLTPIDEQRINQLIVDNDTLCEFLNIQQLPNYLLTILPSNKLKTIIKTQKDITRVLEYLTSSIQKQQILNLLPKVIISNDELTYLWEQCYQQSIRLFNSPSTKPRTNQSYQNVIAEENLQKRYEILCEYINNPYKTNEHFHQALVEKFGYEAFIKRSENSRKKQCKLTSLNI